MTNKMKRYAAFLLCFVMVFAAVPAMAAEGTASSGYGGFVLPEETTSGPTPAGPVLGDNVSFELTIGSPKTFSFYGYDYTQVNTFFDQRPAMTIDVLNKRAVPGLTRNNNQVYLYDVTFTAGAPYLGSIYPSNVLVYDGTTVKDRSGSWTLKVIANTAPADLVPKGQLLNSTDETIYAAIGQEKVISFYGFDYTQIKTFFNGNVDIINEEMHLVPGAYANWGHPVYLYNVTLKMTDVYNYYNDGDMYESNIIFYTDGEPTMAGGLNWKLKVGEDVAENNAAAETETPDLSNVRLVLTTNLDDPNRVRMGTEMVLTATIEGGEGLDFYIWWQSSTDGGETWTDIPGAVGDTYRETITRENSGMEWRACADLVAAEDAE